MRRLILLAILPLLTGCAPKGDKVTTYYDADGKPTHHVEEEVYAGKYSMYKEIVIGIAQAVKESKSQIIQAIKEFAAPRPGESADLAAYKQGQASASIANLANDNLDDVIRVIHYGRDELDVQHAVVDVGGGVLKTFFYVAGAWKMVDTLVEKAGDVTVGEGGTYNANETHFTGNNMGDGNTFDVPYQSPTTTNTYNYQAAP